MANNYIAPITATGITYRVVASETFPNGFDITELADDTDPFDFPDADIAEYGIALNGTLVTWNKAVALPVTFNIVPTLDEDKNLTALYNANRRTKDHQPVGDIITITANYPDGTKHTLTNGIIVSGAPLAGVAQNGRFKTRTFTFVFANAG